MTEWKKKNPRGKKSKTFKPSRKYIQSAVDEYLKKGGKITRLKPERDYKSIVRIKTSQSEADEFLSGE